MLWCLLAVVVVGHAAVATYQAWWDGGFSPFYPARPASRFGSGFYARYNDLGPFLAAASLPAVALASWPRVAGWLRALGGVVALAALVGLAAAQARSSVVALAGGFGVLLLLWWLLPGLGAARRALTLLVVVPLLAGGGWLLASKVLAQRGAGGAAGMLEYDERLFYAGMAIEQIGERPWFGSGSQSFSYEHPRFWPERGWGASRNPRWVHNEVLQTATDYGLVGVALGLAAAGACWLAGARARPLPGDSPVDGALRAGALAATVALGIGALFSFIFHVLPTLLATAFLLAVLLPRRPACRPRLAGPAGAMCALLVAALAVLPAQREARAWWAARALWRGGLPGAEQAEALQAAISRSPSFDNYFQLARLTLDAARAEPDAARRQVLLQQADGQLAAALQRHPYETEITLNRAILLDTLQQFELADALHARVAQVGAPREPWWRGHFFRGRHYHLWGQQLWRQRRPEEALWLLQAARAQMARSQELAALPAEASELAALANENAQLIGFLTTARVAPRRPAELPGD